MYKIIRLTYNEVVVGLPDGSMEKYPIYCINYPNPRVNDIVEVFKDTNEVIITKKTSNLGDNIVNEFNNIGGNQGYGNPNGRLVNKLAYVLFAFFLGSFGIHKFYAGKVGLGILYLVFCWTGIPGIVGIVEAILALTTQADQYGNIVV